MKVYRIRHKESGEFVTNILFDLPDLKEEFPYQDGDDYEIVEFELVEKGVVVDD